MKINKQDMKVLDWLMEEDEFASKAKREGLANKEHLLTITFEIVTPESAESGDFEDIGWEDEDGVSMEPDEDEKEDGETVVTKTVEYLKNNGATNPSDSHGAARWYSDDGYEDYRTGETKTLSYHFVNYTDEEREEIAKLMSKRR